MTDPLMAQQAAVGFIEGRGSAYADDPMHRGYRRAVEIVMEAEQHRTEKELRRLRRRGELTRRQVEQLGL